ncbi:MAG: 50S ribosomal protein L3 [Candidatus Aenigmarchaeota archaeon]|nr:50S ribosomal protein L3 [Candidatus Aenigmarchaeota archaeon]MDW8149373.1 50S ribosomal protein L3 [Candidatus Aenigmarchaeota archaeon]
MPEIKKPRRGSLAFYPRKRAKRIYPVIKTYPSVDKLKLLAFPAYKATMCTVKALTKDNKIVAVPSTILECPPIKIIGLRFYSNGKVITDVFSNNLPKELHRKVRIKPKDFSNVLNSIDLSKITSIRVICCTQPIISGIGKKKPEVFEIGIGGKNISEVFNFAKSILGKEISIKDVFKENQFVDVIAITKGKGTQGPVKRFGVKIQDRHAKKKRRHVGSLGQERPGKVRWTLPMAGQMGFQRRTEYNKLILKIGENGSEINPKGGIVNYGLVKTSYIILKGSVPGSRKRLVFLREPIRARGFETLKFVSTIL